MKQRGYNSKYPSEIKTWRLGEKGPEWLSDVAKIKFIDGEGNVTIERRELNTGGYEIIGSDGVSILVKTSSASDYVCLGDNHIFTLSEIQLKILYR